MNKYKYITNDKSIVGCRHMQSTHKVKLSGTNALQNDVIA